MRAITQNEIIALISDINTFADQAEHLIQATQQQYDSGKAQLAKRHKQELAALEQNYQANGNAVRDKAQRTMRDAKTISSAVERMDSELTKADKYYVKTKKKRESELSAEISGKYAESYDYFTTLSRIQTDFNLLSKKYAEDILPGLLNGLNFLFSSQRKKDYEELILLKNTVYAFIKEMESVLPAVTAENLNALKSQYEAQRNAAIQRHKAESANFENNYAATLDQVAGQIYEALDNILPDEFVQYLQAIMTNYAGTVAKVNNTSDIRDGVLYMCFADYPVEFFVQSKIVASIIQEKCKAILADGAIRLPVILSLEDAPVWLVESDHSNQTAVQAFTHAALFGFLSTCPVASLCCTVIDPENRGNSVAPFFDARKKLPELFDEKFYTGREEIAAKINRLNEKIEDILQDKLGNQYQNIFEYAKQTPGSRAEITLLMLYDFPRGFDERMLAELRNILRNGSRCGIYTIIAHEPEIEARHSQEYANSLREIRNLSMPIQQSGADFLLRGLPLLSYPMPDKGAFAKFFSKYLLVFEGIQNRGIAFSPMIKRLADETNMQALENHISGIQTMMSDYETAYGKVPDANSPFPIQMMLGSVLYPADLFADSPGFGRIASAFGAGGKGEKASFVELPLAFGLGNPFNLLLQSSETINREILAFTHHVMWGFLSFMPVSKVNFCIFDGEQRAGSITPFLDFRQRAPELFDDKIHTTAEDMHNRLQKLNIQIDEFIQEKLGNRYENILEYNLNTPNRPETVTVLLIYDFPCGLDGRSMDLLANILRNGNKCGIFTIICHNPAIQFSRYESLDSRLEQLAKHCISVGYKDGRYGLLPYNLQINLPQPLDSKNVDAFVSAYLSRTETLKKQGLSFQDILPPQLFAGQSADALRIPVGIGDGDSIVSLTLGQGSSHHGLIAGATGSGKSTLLHTIIMSSMLHYSPDALQLYLMDFKSGTEFKIYESARLPHIRLLALDAMQEFGESILENLVAEMGSRAQAFKEAGSVTKIKDYIAVTGKPMPRILVIMDEFQILFNDTANRKVALNCAELAKRLVTEGRAFGIHLLMATQSTKVISSLTISYGTVEQMRVRIGLKCGEDDARYLFSDQNDTKALAMMKGAVGTAVMNLDYTEQANIGFQTAYCDIDTQRQYLEQISKAFADQPYALQTFEGGRVTNLLDHFREMNIGASDEVAVSIHLGTLIKVAPPFVVTIDRKRRHNLLICGTNETMARTVSQDYMISAVLNRNASVYCMDGDMLVGDEGAMAFYHVLGQYTPRFYMAENRADILRFIHEIYEKYQAWKKQNSNESIFVMIENLQFLDIVKSMLKGERVDETEYLDAPAEPEPQPEINLANPFAAVFDVLEHKESSGGNGSSLSAGEKLIKMMEDGSGFGIHFVVSSLEYQTVRDTMYYGSNLLSRFPERVIFALNPTDAGNLIENVSVAGLRDNTVYFTDSVKNTFQLRPHIPPKAAELEKYLSTYPVG